MLLLLAYGLGLGLPFALAGLRRHLGLISQLSAALLVAMGLLLVTDQLGALSLWLQRFSGRTPAALT